MPNLVVGPFGLIANFFISQFHKTAKDSHRHPPPPCVARVIGGSSCQDECSDCRTDYTTCKYCILNKGTSLSLSYVFAFQDGLPSTMEKAFYVIDGHAYPLHEGLAVVYNPNTTPHGIWATSPVDLRSLCPWGVCEATHKWSLPSP